MCQQGASLTLHCGVREVHTQAEHTYRHVHSRPPGNQGRELACQAVVSVVPWRSSPEKPRYTVGAHPPAGHVSSRTAQSQCMGAAQACGVVLSHVHILSSAVLCGSSKAAVMGRTRQRPSPADTGATILSY